MSGRRTDRLAVVLARTTPTGQMARVPVEPLNPPLSGPVADLPVAEALPQLRSALAAGRNAVLVAPPGAGKTTLVAPALLGEPWLAGQIILSLPRRLAARAAAERIAFLLGEPLGRRVGYRTRLDSAGPADAPILCVTEGLLVNRLVADPELAGVGLLLLDEIHERSLDGDLALALALDSQGGLRPDLRLVAMSATVDGAAVARLMGDAALVESAGRLFPVEPRYLGRRPGQRLEQQVASAIAQGLAAEPGSMLVFLPGVAEIERVAALLDLPADVRLHRLHGQADPAAQRAALAADGSRKCILSTSIAETSLTVDGVRLVVDSGLARRPRFDPARGLTRLETVRASRAAIRQRAGRAGRQGPGVVWRLWDAAEEAGLPAFDPPEIRDADLAPLLLRLAAAGIRDPASLRWLDPPPAGARAAAAAHLQALGAFDADGRLTAEGARLARLPMAPRLAAMLLAGASAGAAGLAAEIAALVEEPGLGGRSVDLIDRLAEFRRDRGARATAARRLAARWAAEAERLAPPAGGTADPALLIATAWPDRVARRRRAGGTADRTVSFLMAGGGGAVLDAAEPLAAAEWLVVADAGGAGADARVRLAAVLSSEALAHWRARHASVEDRVVLDPDSGRVVAERVERLGAIRVGRQRTGKPDGAVAAALLLDAVRTAGLASLPWSAAALAERARLAFAAAAGVPGVPAMDDAALLARLQDWLPPRLTGVDRLADISVDGALLALLDWPARQALDSACPTHLETPAGTSHAIDYAADGGPEAEVRVQALFGLAHHPLVAGVPLTLALTSPGGRVIQKTRDLPAFWQGSWRAVQREMKGRYPKHPWPDDPASARATVRTKAADARLISPGPRG